MGFIDLFKRWKLTQKGLSSGKKRRTQSAAGVMKMLGRSTVVKALLYAVFAVAICLLARGAGEECLYHSYGSAQWFMVSLLVGSAGMILFYLGERLLEKNSSVVLLLSGIFTQLLLVRLIGMGVDSAGIDKTFKFLLIPFAFAPMIHSVLLGQRAGVFSLIFVSLFGTLLVPLAEAPIYLATSMTTGALTVGMTGVVRKRGRLLRAGLYVGILVMILAYSFEAIGFGGLWKAEGAVWQGFLLKSGAAFLVGWLTGMIVSGLLPILEGAFSLTTQMSWLEMSDLNHKLMRRMQMEAPGTFQHSLAVASLAEAAAEKIGANAAMCRVCAYFHDIGKMNKPEYFIENQSPDQNPHDELTPTMSALVIIAHVKDGVDMAIRNNLNPRIIDVIQEHHADSLTLYFYRKAQEQRRNETKKVEDGTENEEDLPKVETKNFRYPGPIPQSRESAIISLADTVESASRSLKKVTPQKIQTLVKDLIAKRVAEGQLDDSGLSLGEIKVLGESFSKSLRSMMHSRIEYPGQEKKTKKPKKSSSDSQKLEAENRTKEESSKEQPVVENVVSVEVLEQERQRKKAP